MLDIFIKIFDVSISAVNKIGLKNSAIVILLLALASTPFWPNLSTHFDSDHGVKITTESRCDVVLENQEFLSVNGIPVLFLEDVKSLEVLAAGELVSFDGESRKPTIEFGKLDTNKNYGQVVLQKIVSQLPPEDRGESAEDEARKIMSFNEQSQWNNYITGLKDSTRQFLDKRSFAEIVHKTDRNKKEHHFLNDVIEYTVIDEDADSPVTVSGKVRIVGIYNVDNKYSGTNEAVCFEIIG